MIGGWGQCLRILWPDDSSSLFEVASSISLCPPDTLIDYRALEKKGLTVTPCYDNTHFLFDILNSKPKMPDEL